MSKPFSVIELFEASTKRTKSNVLVVTLQLQPMLCTVPIDRLKTNSANTNKGSMMASNSSAGQQIKKLSTKRRCLD
jgi:hypothetical protein